MQLEGTFEGNEKWHFYYLFSLFFPSLPSVRNLTYRCFQSPSRIKISNVSFRNIRGTTSTQVAVKLICSQGEPCQDVELGDINLEYNGNEGPAMSQCKNIKPNLLGVQLPRICS